MIQESQDVKSKIYNSSEIELIQKRKTEISNFLFEHLDEFGDEIEDIEKCIDYVITPNRGGLIFLIEENDKIIGAVIVNYTHMKGFIPENILVYIAVHRSFRGKGIGKLLMNKVINNVKGDIALHVEPQNTARFLYEKHGFKSKYLEMRLQNA
jgi:GNAT superfamily N-acetyltransferase